MNAPLTHARFETPFGELQVFADERGVVRCSGFRDAASIAAQLPVELSGRGWQEGSLPLVERALSAWLAGDGDAITAVEVEQSGGPFFQELWHALRAVPAGEPVTYQELAEAAGRPRASRAAGTACARNAVAPFVPCHRVLSSGHKVGAYGFGGGSIKAGMLMLEAGGSLADVAAAMRSGTSSSAAPSRDNVGHHARARDAQHRRASEPQAAKWLNA